MNLWLHKSIQIANQTDYLDQLYKVYPMANNLLREVSDGVKVSLKEAFAKKDNIELLKILLKQDIFPIKDSYVAYLKRDKTAIARNPQTIDRLAGIMYELGLDGTLSSITRPIETNRQIGPLFRYWLKNKSLGMDATESIDEFLSTECNLVLVGSDGYLGNQARKYFGYTHGKGLDFIAKCNQKIILGEAKFLTDFGGHQNAQFNDAMATLHSKIDATEYEVQVIAILDGINYIRGKNKMFHALQVLPDDKVIISALLLRDYLYAL